MILDNTTYQTREELIKILPKHAVGMEIGVFKGEFTNLLLEETQPSTLYLVDPWEGEIMSGDKNGQNIEYITGPDYYLQHIVPEFLFKPNVKILRHYSDILSLFPDQHLDWIYIDGAHDYDYVREDLEYSFSKVKKGGYILGHDYTNYMFPGLVMAVDEFCKEHNLTIKYITQDGCPSYLIVNE